MLFGFNFENLEIFWWNFMWEFFIYLVFHIYFLIIIFNNLFYSSRGLFIELDRPFQITYTKHYLTEWFRRWASLEWPNNSETSSPHLTTMFSISTRLASATSLMRICRQTRMLLEITRIFWIWAWTALSLLRLSLSVSRYPAY